jgi:nucleotide-binding universal stress UspA family protein
MHTSTPAPVVVGVDGSAESHSAVAAAVREATLRQVPLSIVHAYAWPLTHVPLEPAPFAPRGRPRASRGGDPRRPVVGSRGLGGFRGLLLGSVSQTIIHHAECPVTIVQSNHH